MDREFTDAHPPCGIQDFQQLAREYRVLLREYGRAQMRCSERLSAQAKTIELLRAQVMRLRAGVILRETALAWAREDRAILEQAIPGLPGRIRLARSVETLLARIQALMRERSNRDRLRCQTVAAGPPRDGEAVFTRLDPDDPVALEAGLNAADLVICQAGCLTHGAYGRLQAHCRRMGKACILVERPEALRIVRIHGRPS